MRNLNEMGVASKRVLGLMVLFGMALMIGFAIAENAAPVRNPRSNASEAPQYQTPIFVWPLPTCNTSPVPTCTDSSFPITGSITANPPSAQMTEEANPTPQRSVKTFPQGNTNVLLQATPGFDLATGANQTSMAATLNGLTANILAASAGVSSVSAPTTAFATGSIYRSTQGTKTDGQFSALESDSRNNLKATILGVNGNTAWIFTSQSSDTTSPQTNSSVPHVNSTMRLYTSGDALSRQRQADAFSNTATALGMALVGQGRYLGGPVTFTGTGQSTAVTLTSSIGAAAFQNWSCQCKATGAITAYTIALEASQDGTNWDTTNPLVTTSTMTNDGQIFFTSFKHARYVRLDATVFTIGAGTNVICNFTGTGF